MNKEDAMRAAAELYFGASKREASGAIGCSVDTLTKWMQHPDWPGIWATVEANEIEILASRARRVIRAKLEEYDAITARWVLERQDKQFASKTTVTHEGKVEHEHSALPKLSVAQLEALESADDAYIDAIFEEATPLALTEEE